MRKKMQILQKYCQWLLKQYQSLEKPREVYRLIRKEIDKSSECILFIQVIGKAMTFKVKATTVAADDVMLEGFSKKDIRLITYYAFTQKQKPQYKILAYKFCNKINKMIFKIQKRGSDIIDQKTADEISSTKSLIKNLSQEDAHMIGYTTGTEQILREKIEIEKALANEENH